MGVASNLITIEGCLEDFRRKAQEFHARPLDPFLACDCAIAAWSIYDWVKEFHKERLGFETKAEMFNGITSQCPELAHLREVANYRKHGKAETGTLTLKRYDQHDHSFSRGFNEDHTSGSLQLITANNEKIWMEDAILAALAFWEAFFVAQGIIDAPPHTSQGGEGL